MNAEAEEWVIEYWDTVWLESDLHNMILEEDETFSKAHARTPLLTLSRAALVLKVRERLWDQREYAKIIYRLRNVRTGDILPSLIL